MLRPAAAFEMLRDGGIGLFTGVPDSLLKDFCAYVADHALPSEHIIAANEGNAIALAVGQFLGTGKPALVYMQNSGLGNAVNPLLSLADREVYGIPMLLMIGWRGEPGVKDEPQHVKQGRVTVALLEAMEIPCFILDGETPDPAKVVSAAIEATKAAMGPAALLVRKGAFEGYRPRRDESPALEMDRERAIMRVVDLLGAEDIVVSTTGMASRELYEYRASRGDGHGGDFLTVGGMGHTASIALGLARTRPERMILCLDGDGSVIMHMGALAVLGQSGIRNLLHVVLNNGAHDSVGGQPTVGLAMDLAGVARACGYRRAISVTAESEIGPAMAALKGIGGPSLLEIRVRKGSRPDLGRPKSTPMENREALMRRLGKTDG